MSRKSNYSTEQLLQFVEHYLRARNSLELINCTEMAEYCNHAFGLFPTITYQNFTRDKKVKEWIENYNQKLYVRVINNQGESNIIPENLYNVENAISQCSSEKGCRLFIQDVNKQIAKLTEINHEFSEQYQKILQEKEMLMEENDVLRAENSKTVTKLKEIQKEIRNEKKKAAYDRSIKDKVFDYLKKNVYDPAVIDHFRAIYTLPDDDNDDKKSTEPKLVGDDIKECIEQFYIKSENTDVMTAKSAELYDKISQL